MASSFEVEEQEAEARIELWQIEFVCDEIVVKLERIQLPEYLIKGRNLNTNHPPSQTDTFRCSTLSNDSLPSVDLMEKEISNLPTGNGRRFCVLHAISFLHSKAI